MQFHNYLEMILLNYKDTSLHLILVLNENITIYREKILLIDFNFTHSQILKKD